MANNHLLIEEWLLSAANLTPQEHAQLQEHLNSCEFCRQLSAAWQEVEVQLKAAPTRSPEPGFTLRWQSRLAQEQQRRQRLQTATMLAFGVGVALSLVLLLGLLAFAGDQKPAALLNDLELPAHHILLLFQRGGAGFGHRRPHALRAGAGQLVGGDAGGVGLLNGDLDCRVPQTHITQEG